MRNNIGNTFKRACENFLIEKLPVHQQKQMCCNYGETLALR